MWENGNVQTSCDKINPISGNGKTGGANNIRGVAFVTLYWCDRDKSSVPLATNETAIADGNEDNITATLPNKLPKDIQKLYDEGHEQ